MTHPDTASSPGETIRHVLRCESDGQRLDTWLTTRLDGFSRARIQQLIKDGFVLVDGKSRKPHHVLQAGSRVEVSIPPPQPTELKPESIPINLLYEDSDILVLNKPPGLVVHPAPGHASGTLVNALLHHCGDTSGGRSSLGGIGGELRPGIVHRLDKDTSGVLVVAKNQAALDHLAGQFKRHSVRKEYVALVWGCPHPETGTIESLVGRDPHNRKKMSAKPRAGRRAVTHYRVLERHEEASVLKVEIETGRTHQIRVHLAHIGHPVVGDTQYGRARVSKHAIKASRQLLHAERLAFAHPRTGKPLEFHAPIPEDMSVVIRALRA